MNTKIVLGIIAGLALLVGLWFVPTRQTTTTIIDRPQGAVSSPEVGPYIDISGNTLTGVSGVCNDQSATLWNFENPVGATTTVISHIVRGQNGTTTITLESGTTSIATLLGGSAPAPLGINAKGIGTSTAFTILGGLIQPTGGLATSSGASTYDTFTIGPTDRLYGRATSTTDHQAKTGDPTLEGLTNTNNQFTCEYEYLFRN